ncbi:MAG: Kef family K(+) transporter [Bradyrhizobiaceae bacterium]|uniref:Putative cation:proton antiport protein n=1 Tax=Syncephalis pseudoplumigaleata TaxID=1712513 RepID=A0A4P9Z6H1_9FUNG|nr:putative cation:proton antiport protein [Syncephalis pseudoplumigaleata]RTL75292.1 MAG: Kef family K(+) transporter [Bradyrhizobiaceae bacterium]|eukprot:RKP28254.1 putative cation:proton antiport protein [Syncephalis pseudoplumigaleata]
MHHNTPLISTVVVGLVLAFVLGALAQRVRISPLVGYLLAGVVMGPFTPGYVADQNIANELAEIGIILLMFGVGLHFSLKDLLSVRAIAVPGAVVQIAVATLLGMGLGWTLGWPVGGGLVFGLALSVASTVVLLRALQERRLVDTERGRIAVGWLIVEDLAMVLTLVLLPALAGLLKGEGASGLSAYAMAQPVLITLGKVAAFVIFMLVVGRRVIPWVLHYVAHTGSRELFRLAVFAISLGVAFGAAILFDVSFALGAFFAGMILSESELSQRAANETLPLRDAFAVLFFVSVGMLVDPAIIVREPLPLLATVFIIIFGKSVAAFGIVRMFRHPTSTALTISASLAQIGEFSFILVSLGVSLALLPDRGRDLVLAGAIISIMLNPLFFALLDRYEAKKQAAEEAAAAALSAEDSAAEVAAEAARKKPARVELPVTALTGHVVLVGYGRVGSVVGASLKQGGVPLLVIEDNPGCLEKLAQAGIEKITGNAAAPGMLVAANLEAARGLIVAIPDAFEGGQIVSKARAISATLPIIARAHSEEEIAHLKHHGANSVIMGEQEIAKAMIAQIGLASI